VHVRVYNIWSGSGCGTGSILTRHPSSRWEEVPIDPHHGVPPNFQHMTQQWKARAAAVLVAALGLGGITAVISASWASATSAVTSPATSTTCTQYLVTAPAAVEVWIDPDSTVPNQIWNKLPRGNVFCAYEENVAHTRFRVRYNCHPAQNCNPVGPYTGWVTTDPQAVTPVNCTVHTLTRQVTVFTTAQTPDEVWTTWPSGTSFCDFGRNPDGTRFQVYLYCGLPACHRPEGTWVGWVSTNPIYYGSTAPPSCRPWPTPCTALPTATALPD
jgi:hypothetical protein